MTRQAALTQSHKRLRSGDLKYPLQRLCVDGHTQLGKFELELAPRITVLVGPSGAGKSRLLTAMHRCMTAGENSEITVELDCDAARLVCRLVDPAEECFTILSHVRSIEGLEAKRDVAERSTLDERSLTRLGYILGRDYEKAAFTELSREDGVNGRWRYYELTYRGRTYGPTEMSGGELAAMSVIMALKALRPNHVLLLDEPENFLSPRARARLADVLIESAAIKSTPVSLVVASHSAELVERIPPVSLRLLRHHPATGMTIEGTSHTAPALERLGLQPRPKVLAVVEDVLAVTMLDSLLALTAPQLRPMVQIIQIGGDGNVPKLVNPLQNSRFGLQVIGVLDGDSRNKVDSGQLTFPTGRIAFLPGTQPPDTLLMKVLNDTVTVVADHLGVEENALLQAIESAEGLDHHDRLPKVAETLGFPIAHVTQILVRTLADKEVERQQISDLVSLIEGLMRD